MFVFMFDFFQILFYDLHNCFENKYKLRSRNVLYILVTSIFCVKKKPYRERLCGVIAKLESRCALRRWQWLIVIWQSRLQIRPIKGRLRISRAADKIRSYSNRLFFVVSHNQRSVVRKVNNSVYFCSVCLREHNSGDKNYAEWWRFAWKGFMYNAARV